MPAKSVVITSTTVAAVEICKTLLSTREGLKLNIEIHKPELVRRLNAHIQTGHFPDAAALIEQALDAFDEKSRILPVVMHGSLHEFFMNSPLRGANLDLTRALDYSRAVDLE